MKNFSFGGIGPAVQRALLCSVESCHAMVALIDRYTHRKIISIAYQNFHVLEQRNTAY